MKKFVLYDEGLTPLRLAQEVLKRVFLGKPGICFFSVVVTDLGEHQHTIVHELVGNLSLVAVAGHTLVGTVVIIIYFGTEEHEDVPNVIKRIPLWFEVRTLPKRKRKRFAVKKFPMWRKA